MKVIENSEYKVHKNSSQIELCHNCEAQQAENQNLFTMIKLPVVNYNPPYRVTPGLSSITQYTTISKSSYTNFTRNSKSKKRCNKSLDNKDYCCYRKY